MKAQAGERSHRADGHQEQRYHCLPGSVYDLPSLPYRLSCQVAYLLGCLAYASS
jgi:hypothetical protein